MNNGVSVTKVTQKVTKKTVTLFPFPFSFPFPLREGGSKSNEKNIRYSNDPIEGIVGGFRNGRQGRPETDLSEIVAIR